MMFHGFFHGIYLSIHIELVPHFAEITGADVM
jgi:hypothetical protein